MTPQTILWAAARAAGQDDALLSLVYNEQAWLRMERLDVSKAKEYFGKAREHCEALAQSGQFEFRKRLYHIRHGLAMAQRLVGDVDGAYAQYDRLVKELRGLMAKDLEFSPKERRDLRDRMINSMERRADVRFFARQSPTHFASNIVTVENYRIQLRKVERDYQEAVDEVANDDLARKTLLIYKKFITHCLADIGGPAPENNPSPHQADIEYAEAQKTYNTLPIELKKDLTLAHKIADCCMDLHSSDQVAAGGRRYDSQNVVGLRDLTVEYAKKCENLDREKVEMLLVAFEILLEEGVEPKAGQNSQDASRMMAVLGATTKLASHSELQAYVDRFSSIATTWRMAGPARQPKMAQAPLREKMPFVEVRRDPPNAERELLFSIRVSPTQVLTVSKVRDDDTPLTARGLPTVTSADPQGPVDGP